MYIDINLSHGKQKRRATFILAATSASDLTTFTFSPFFFYPLTKQPPFKKKVQNSPFHRHHRLAFLISTFFTWERKGTEKKRKISKREI